MDSAAAAITWLLRVLSTLAQAVFAKVSAYIPVLLVFDFVVTSWIVCHFLVTVHILPVLEALPNWVIPPSPSTATTAFVLLGVYFFVLVHTLGPLCVIWVYSWRILRHGYTFPEGAKFFLKPVMQALPNEDNARHWFTEGLRPNLCRHCLFFSDPESGEGPRPILDRIYHGKTYEGKDLGCIPLFDHWKSYLLFTVWILIYHLFSLGTILWAIPSWSTRWALAPVVVAAASLPFVFFWVKRAPFRGQWLNQACRNQTHLETGIFIRGRPKPAWPMVINGSNGFEHVLVDFNPWDLGLIGNLRAALGDSIWEWPFFWRVPRRVWEYGTSPSEDLPFGPKWAAFMEARSLTLPPSIDLTPLPPALRNPVSRRRHGFSSED
ncbi:DHHC zinc finger domain-containing protein [Colletotrichum nymphaeae SA-01]|uniref:DHHC zinc finger domain-containing protein n=1 Tax=Colletotrichum nymphaeae SA-01 TaxID=1460502 RepID=A0A135UJM1_9PEZI|nr:DHHC zinc finger domain-containing protein [Colletotrichum nymphaeae SA-01]